MNLERSVQSHSFTMNPSAFNRNYAHKLNCARTGFVEEYSVGYDERAQECYRDTGDTANVVRRKVNNDGKYKNG